MNKSELLNNCDILSIVIDRTKKLIEGLPDDIMEPKINFENSKCILEWYKPRPREKLFFFFKKKLKYDNLIVNVYDDVLYWSTSIEKEITLKITVIGGGGGGICKNLDNSGEGFIKNDEWFSIGAEGMKFDRESRDSQEIKEISEILLKHFKKTEELRNKNKAEQAMYGMYGIKI